MSIRHKLRKKLWKLGIDISRFHASTNPLARRKKLLGTYRIEVVLDVGANCGQYAEQLRKDLGYSGRIISFEPMGTAFSILKERAAKDRHWDAFNYALSSTDEAGEINVSGNSVSSSLLDMLPRHAESAPDSEYVGKERIDIKRLDSIFDKLRVKSQRIYLKIDAQGLESEVLTGATQSLALIDTVQLEMSLAPLYKDASTFDDLFSWLTSRDYQLVGIESGFSDPKTGEVLQVDGTFHRPRWKNSLS